MPVLVARAIGIDPHKMPRDAEMSRLFEARRADTGEPWSQHKRKLSTRAPDRADERPLPRLLARPHRAAPVRRTRRRLEHAVADDRAGAGQGPVGAEGLRPLASCASSTRSLRRSRWGLVGWFVIGIPIILVVVPSLTSGPSPSPGWFYLGPSIAVIATIAVTIFAPTDRIAWGCLCLLNGLVSSLGLPLASIVFSLLLGHHAETGVKIGAGLGGVIAPGMLRDRGLLFGRDFLMLAGRHLAECAAPIVASARGCWRGFSPRRGTVFAYLKLGYLGSFQEVPAFYY
jgi:hypothetical protein